MHHIVMFLHNPYTHDVRVRREAQSLVQNGYRVSVVSWDRGGEFPKQEELEGVQVYRNHLSAKRGLGVLQLPVVLAVWLWLAWRAARLKPDSFHAHDFMGLVPSVIASLFLRKKMIYDAHESFPSTLIKRTSPLVIRFANWVERILMKRAEAIITVSQRLKESIEERGGQNVVIVGNWKDRAQFEYDEMSIKQEKYDMNLINCRIVISYLGLLSPERSIPQLIEAVKQCSDIGLVIAGYGPSTSLVVDASQQYPNIHFLGLLPIDQIPFYTQLADVVYYCLEPDYAGGKFSSPNKLFEAIAAGKALLVTRGIGEVGEIVTTWKSVV